MCQAASYDDRLIPPSGFSNSLEKVQSPSTCVQYLGLCIDSIKMKVGLPPKKLFKLVELEDTFLEKSVSTKKNLQELWGHLAHASQVIQGGRTFVASRYQLAKIYGREGNGC